jgi:hypothetical protein
MVDCVIERWGRVDILVSNAGEMIRTYFDTLTVGHIQRSMAVNFYGGVHAILAVLPHMRERGSGHIVVVTSMDGKIGIPKEVPYATAKFAMTGFAVVAEEGQWDFCEQCAGAGGYPLIQDLSTLISPKAAGSGRQSRLRAIEKRKPDVIVPPMAIIFHYTHALSPRLSDWFTRFLHLEGWED